MQMLAESCVSSWRSKDGKNSHPALIDCHCGSCSRLVSFATMDDWKTLSDNCFYAVARCPGCKLFTHFVIFNKGTGLDSLAGGSLYMYPCSKFRSPNPEVIENPLLSDPLKRAYISAVNVTNANEWSASAVLCRRLVEGIAKSIIPDALQDRPLAQQLEQLPSYRDLSAPLLQLAHAVRKGGNLGAHFDLEKEPDQEVAQLMVELCEDLLEYLFVLPVRIQYLHDKIEKLGTKTDGIEKIKRDVLKEG